MEDERTYTVIAHRYDDDDFIDNSGLTKEQAIDNIARLEAETSRYDRYSFIGVYQDLTDEEIGEVRGAAAARSVAAKAAKLDAEKLRAEQQKREYEKATRAARLIQYEALKKEFENANDK